MLFQIRREISLRKEIRGGETRSPRVILLFIRVGKIKDLNLRALARRIRCIIMALYTGGGLYSLESKYCSARRTVQSWSMKPDLQPTRYFAVGQSVTTLITTNVIGRESNQDCAPFRGKSVVNFRSS